MSERQDHNRADALDYVRHAINLEARRHIRRMKSIAEAEVNRIFDDCQARRIPFDYRAAGVAGVQKAESLFIIDEMPAIDAGEDDGVSPAAG